jgi:hypothetical protein
MPPPPKKKGFEHKEGRYPRERLIPRGEEVMKDVTKKERKKVYMRRLTISNFGNTHTVGKALQLEDQIKNGNVKGKK